MSANFIDRLSIRRRPRGLPLLRQWWGKLLFMHWPVPGRLLRPMLPPQLTLDTYEGTAWLGVVPFTMWGFRPYLGPPVPGLNSFHELNVRTYVHYDGVPGVWFFSLDINSLLAVWGARRLYFLPYYRARLSLAQQGQVVRFTSERAAAAAPPAAFAAEWSVGDPLPPAEPGSLEFFLTERYCLYSAARGQLFRCRIAHDSWPLRRAELSDFDSTMVEALGLPTPAGDPVLHYAEAIKVDVWPLRRVRTAARARSFESVPAAETFV
ncbi:MAG TPA: DUF2071 domain-containing protein [Pyrinomonadaceae bacterium]|nr:DUF2071 domain-containing protein [Pyrinomonadaceae bacterium]